MKSWTGATRLSAKMINYGKSTVSYIMAKGGRLLWLSACGTLLVLIPILFEVQREVFFPFVRS